MSGFIYHIPGYNGTIDHSSIQRHCPNLAEQFGVISFDSRKVSVGPSGQAGVIFCMTGRLTAKDGQRLRYEQKNQTWQKTKDGYWIGYWNGDLPNPLALQRPAIMAGYLLQLNDGNQWAIPIIRHVETGGSALPEVMTYNSDGVVVFEPMAKYAELTHLADRVWRQALIDSGIDATDDSQEGDDSVVGEFEPMSTEDRWKFATKGLAMNYFIGEAEIAILKIITFNPELDQGNINSICKAMIDINSVIGVMKALDAAKKNESDVTTQSGSDTSNGDVA